jgi:hypothetical protein
VLERVKPVPDASRIKDDDRAASQPVAGGCLEEIALDVVDDNRVRPGQKLADGKKPLAAPRRRVD